MTAAAATDDVHVLATSADAPLTHLADDLLGHREFVERVYRLLIECPPEWPVRVALRGGWGSGKTTVALFVEALAQEKHLFVRYPVSTQTSIEDLWIGFAFALCKAIEAKELPLNAKQLPWRKLEAAAFTRKAAKRGRRSEN